MNQLTKQCSELLRMTLAKKFTSVSYAIWQNNEMVAADSLGWQDQAEKKEATLNCTYNVASVSKIYCTVAIMKLVEKNKIALDDYVVDYVTDFVMADERYKQITIRQCLNHTSGLPGTQWKGFSVTSVTPRNYHQEVLDYFSYSHLKANPGEYAVYCNDGFTLAELVVERVSGLSFAQFVYQMITNPIEANSTRYINDNLPEYPLVREKDKPAELLLVRGAGGISTSMTDLIRFGRLFIEDNDVISAQSKAEMAKCQGASFLVDDQKSAAYGLGWDTVKFSDPQYCLGEGVLAKGGNSFQFTSQLLVLPQYQAVLAISETHDCGIDVTQAILSLFSLCMMNQGIQIYANQKRIPEEIKQQCSGIYLMPSSILEVKMEGTVAHIQTQSMKQQPEPMASYCTYDGHCWKENEQKSYFFSHHQEDTYLMCNLKNVSYPMAMKAKSFPVLSETWKSRLNKQYIVVNASVEDLVIGEIMTGFKLYELANFTGILIASFSGKANSDVYSGGFDGSFIPVDEHSGKGFLNTPYNGSRDLLDPCFEMIDDKEFCHVASYTYQEVSSLPVYHQTQFDEEASLNQAFRIESEITEYPAIPQGHRILILSSELEIVQDSLDAKELTPVQSGYMILI